MREYITYCTREQVERSLNLGIPLEKGMPLFIKGSKLYKVNGKCYYVPTTQQMINWLREETGIVISICQSDGGHYYYYKLRENLKEVCEWNTFLCYEAAELSAINAALDYLEKEVME